MAMMKRTGIAIVAALMASGTALAQESAPAPQELAVNYDVNMGGFTLGGGRLRASFTEVEYDARITIRTAGLANWLFNSRYNNTSAGRVDGDDIFPTEYNSDFRGHDDDDYQVVSIGYDETTPFLIEADPSYGRRLERFPVTDEQRADSYDPLNAALYLISGMPFSEEAPCGERIRVFDGRRRYDLVMEHVGYEDLRLRGGEVWDGETLVCHLNYEEVAGFKPQPEDDELPRPPLTVNIAQLEEGYHVPVRVRAPTPIGSMVMMATFMRVRDVEPAPLGEDAPDQSVAAPVN